MLEYRLKLKEASNALKGHPIYQFACTLTVIMIVIIRYVLVMKYNLVSNMLYIYIFVADCGSYGNMLVDGMYKTLTKIFQSLQY